MDALRFIDQFIQDVDRALHLDDIFTALQEQIKRLGFDVFTYWLLWPPEGPRIPLYISSYPQEWVDYYLNNNYGSEDIIRRHAINNSLPFLWSDITQHYKLSDAQRLVFHEGADAGLTSGASIPIHGPGAAKATFSVAQDESSKDFKRHFLMHRHELQLLATYAHERILQLGLENMEYKNVKLTPREIEVLTWTARGKTRWEISTILNLSEETIKTHLVKACQKLGVSNKTHAIACAIIHGLILP